MTLVNSPRADYFAEQVSFTVRRICGVVSGMMPSRDCLLGVPMIDTPLGGRGETIRHSG